MRNPTMSTQDRLMRIIDGATSTGKHVQFALAGHRGSGKSTELIRFIHTARENGYLPLYAASTEAIDPDDVTFSDLLRLMMQLLEYQFQHNQDNQKLKNWPKRRWPQLKAIFSK